MKIYLSEQAKKSLIISNPKWLFSQFRHRLIQGKELIPSGCRKWFLLFFFSCEMAKCAAQLYPAGESIPVDFESSGYSISVSKEKLQPIKDSVNLSALMPPAQNQGDQTSCWAWATTYALRSTMGGKSTYLINNSVLDSSKVFSPAYTYSYYLGNKDPMFPDDCHLTNNSAQILDSILKNGVLSMREFPSRNRPCTAEIDDGRIAAARKNAIKGYKATIGRGLDNLKAVLSESQIVVVSMVIDDDFRTPGKINIQNPWWTQASGRGIPVEHAMVCVGYNKDGILVYNSWGPNFGDHGFAWISTTIASIALRYFCYPQKVKAPENLSPTKTAKPSLSGESSTLIQDTMLHGQSILVDTAWFKTGYYVAFDSLKFVLSKFSKRKRYAVVEVRNWEYDLLRNMYLEEQTAADFKIENSAYKFDFVGISPAGRWYNIFHRNAVHFIISKTIN